MQDYVYPFFAPGRVLKREAIENLRDFPRDFLDIAYADYSDGIICGFDVTYASGKLHIAGGAVKHDGRIIVLKETVCDFTRFNENIRVNLRFGETKENEDFLVIDATIGLSRGSDESDGIELARFRLAEGAALRKKSEYKGVSDFITYDNTLNLVNVRYSGLYHPTFSPELLKIFAKEILKTSQDGADITFALICLNSNIVHKDCILQYLNNRLNADLNAGISNGEIYRELCDIANRRDGPQMKKRLGGGIIG